MRSSSEGTEHGAPPAGLASVNAGPSHLPDPAHLLSLVLKVLDDAKAENVVTIDLKGKTSIGDHMIVASGRSQRHVGAVADQLVKALKDAGFGRARVEGMPQCDWVLIDTGDVVVHIFRPEVREFYNLEKMWSADRPIERLAV
ncbi:ribosome silencing factor [Methyloligella sp. 2.7D]|uniref:ribosome silencing factor n=1 Tax=unclassified Methyloligella TaxID=2625955 RepID=UPI00157E0EEC|nr:ribosome silencing factor [Methyloligella sp. GL2]QKP76363.1 ribosome silencing factor [Methyloligella sp. GL2]